jgi:hypothetical protein
MGIYGVFLPGMFRYIAYPWEKGSGGGSGSFCPGMGAGAGDRGLPGETKESLPHLRLLLLPHPDTLW